MWVSTGLAAGICSQNLWEVVGFTLLLVVVTTRVRVLILFGTPVDDDGLLFTGYGNEFTVFLLGFNQFGALTGKNGWALFVLARTEDVRAAGTILLLLLFVILWC